jgi:capsular polysaccharide biosynthesis protein
MKPRLMLRSVDHAMRAVSIMHSRGLRVPNGLLHRVAAVHRRVRRLLWPVLARKTPFKRIVQISTGGKAIASLTAVVPVTAPWSVVIRDGRDRAFADRTYDFNHGRLKLKGAFVASLSHAYVHTSTGLVCTADGELIADSAKKVERHIDAAIGLDLPSKRLLAGSWATVMSKFHHNYYHWFNDSLLRLYLLDRLPGRHALTILVPPTLRPFQMQSLRYCLPAAASIECLPDDWVQVERLVLPSFITEPLVGMVPPDAAAFVRARVVAGVCGNADPPVRRRIYISRAGTGHRQILNEADLMETLREFQFEIVRPEGLSFEEQVRLFRSADLIVGARGAALTNMMFAERARILEITSDVPFAGAVYFSMAYSLGHEHHHLFCQRRGVSYMVDPRAFRQALRTLVEA